jgi:hypothetical protein
VRRARALVLASALATSGCFWHHRLDTNAPGHVSLEPPANPEAYVPDQPRGPGDQSLLLSGRAFLGGGAGVDQTGAFRGSVTVGAEAIALYGLYDRSVTESFWCLFPARAVGAGFGWSPLQSWSSNPRLHAELHGRLLWGQVVMLGLALGWAWEPGVPGVSGPQATASAGPLFLRGSYLRGRGTTVQIGFNVEPVLALVWSR